MNFFNSDPDHIEVLDVLESKTSNSTTEVYSFSNGKKIINLFIHHFQLLQTCYILHDLTRQYQLTVKSSSL